MLFNSLEFGVFFVLVYAVYRLLPHRGQNLWLLAASYLFYSAWDWRFLGLILVSTVVDYTVALRLQGTESEARRKAWLTASIVTNLGILVAFKYAGFFVDSWLALLALGGFSAEARVWNLVLPVGISFYTFQTLSYTIDVYRRKIEATRDGLDFALFVAFFPQLVAGPIERAGRLLPQIAAPRKISFQHLSDGAWLILWGLFKKVVISDNLAIMVDAVFHPKADPTGVEVILGIYAVTIQVYCDFSAYSDIARGLAKWLGFELMINFRVPYLAANPSQLFSRWHISLTTWLRDYVFVALGGGLRGWRTYRNLWVTMTLCGLWHGASWTFVLWGAYHGAWLVAHRIARPWLKRLRPRAALPRALWHGLTVVSTFLIFSFSGFFFRSESLTHALDLMARLADPSPGLAASWLPALVALTLPLWLMQIAQEKADDLDVIQRASIGMRAFVYLGLILGIVLLGQDFGQPFVYFQF